MERHNAEINADSSEVRHNTFTALSGNSLLDDDHDTTESVAKLARVIPAVLLFAVATCYLCDWLSSKIPMDRVGSSSQPITSREIPNGVNLR